MNESAGRFQAIKANPVHSKKNIQVIPFKEIL
jgi:hypothetical protein